MVSQAVSRQTRQEAASHGSDSGDAGTGLHRGEPGRDYRSGSEPARKPTGPRNTVRVDVHRRV